MPNILVPQPTKLQNYQFSTDVYILKHFTGTIILGSEHHNNQ